MPCILTRCRAFIFARAQYSPIQAFTARFALSMQFTTHITKQRTGLYNSFSCDCASSTAHDTKPTQAAIIPPVPRWSAYTRQDAPTRYQPPRGTLHRSAQPPIIIRYIREQTMPAAAGQLLPCADRWQVLTHCQQYRPGAPADGSVSPPIQGQPGGVSMLPTPGGLRSGTGSAVRAGILAPSTRRGSPAAGARRAARNHWRLSPHLFSGFRPIANRGQQ